MLRRLLLISGAVCVALTLAACAAKTTGTTKVTDGSATLHASGSCDLGQHCTWYWQYWPASGPRSAATTTPVQGPVTGPASYGDLTTTVTGLAPATAYRWVFCASPNDGGIYACAGPTGTFDSTTADPPADYATFTTLTQRTLAERSISGGRWTVQRTANPSAASLSRLSGISCDPGSGGASPPALCTAVGNYTDSAGTSYELAESYDGTSWTPQSLPSPENGSLTAVSCSSQTPPACTAVGSDTDVSRPPLLAVRWNGTSWTDQALAPSGGFASVLLGVSCPTATMCLAVGSELASPHIDEPLAELWNGTDWTLLSPPNLGDQDFFSAVSCVSATACTAVGGSASPPVVAASWNGSTWSAESVPVPSGAQGAEFSGLSCTSASACTAVGSYSPSSGPEQTLAERWNGTAWAIQPTPNPVGATFSSLIGASCTSGTSCSAVGTSADSSGTRATLAESWNGTTWTIVPSASPLRRVNDELLGVSCLAAPDVCEAVGTR